MPHVTKLTLVFGAGLVAAACNSGVTEVAPSETVEVMQPSLAVTNTGWVPFNFTDFNPCNDEFIDMTTQRKQIIIVTDDGAGGYHVGSHLTWRGKGVGQTTGAVYHLNHPHQIQEYFRGPFPQTSILRIDNNLVSRGSGDNLIFAGTRKMTINANGDVTSQFFHFTGIRCVG